MEAKPKMELMVEQHPDLEATNLGSIQLLDENGTNNDDLI